MFVLQVQLRHDSLLVHYAEYSDTFNGDLSLFTKFYLKKQI